MKICIVRLLVAIFSCITLRGCSLCPSESITPHPTHPNLTGKNYVDPQLIEDSATKDFAISALPSCEFVNISNCFTTSNIEFDTSQDILSLICANLDEDKHSTANDIIYICAEERQNMVLHCNWAPCSRNVYIGFQSVDSNNIYLGVFSDGEASVTLDLSIIPDGKYRIIMFSNDNSSITAVLNYQISHSD